MDKLQVLANDFGFDTVEDMLEAATFDSVAPAICMNPFCNYTCEYEPDCRDGWCEECGQNTVQSCLVVEGLI